MTFSLDSKLKIDATFFKTKDKFEAKQKFLKTFSVDKDLVQLLTLLIMINYNKSITNLLHYQL